VLPQGNLSFPLLFSIYLLFLCTINLCLFRSHERHFKLKTQNHGKLFSLMHHVVKGDDPEVKQGKPSPDVFLAALRRFEVLNNKK
jgi:beta-phosphoglucomutase-like phosphatase (HAD superfamily)